MRRRRKGLRRGGGRLCRDVGWARGYERRPLNGRRRKLERWYGHSGRGVSEHKSRGRLARIRPRVRHDHINAEPTWIAKRGAAATLPKALHCRVRMFGIEDRVDASHMYQSFCRTSPAEFISENCYA